MVDGYDDNADNGSNDIIEGIYNENRCNDSKLNGNSCNFKGKVTVVKLLITMIV